MKTSIPKSKRPLPKSKSLGLRAKPQEKTAWAQLPFVGADHASASDWDVPLIGGYFGGLETGSVIARMFLKYLRDERKNPLRLGTERLKGILAALDHKQPADAEERAALRGQKTGFIGELAVWLEAASETLGSSLDAIPHRSFIKQANEALERSDAAFMAAVDLRSAQ